MSDRFYRYVVVKYVYLLSIFRFFHSILSLSGSVKENLNSIISFLYIVIKKKIRKRIEMIKIVIIMFQPPILYNGCLPNTLHIKGLGLLLKTSLKLIYLFGYC